MTMTIDKEQVSRRGVLAGLGGMSFCFAIGADGARLISEAEANTPGRRQAVQRLGAHRAERRHHDLQRRRRNGTGLDDLAAADRGGGNGRRLVEGFDRVGADRPEPTATPTVVPAGGTRCRWSWGTNAHAQRVHDDRRQPRGHDVLQRPAHGRRAGAQGPAAERRREVGRRCRDASHRAERRHQSGQRPAADLWRDRCVRQDPLAASGRRRERTEEPRRSSG